MYFEDIKPCLFILQIVYFFYNVLYVAVAVAYRKVKRTLNVEFNTKLKFKNAEHSRVGVKNLIKIPLWLRKRKTEFPFLLLKLLHAWPEKLLAESKQHEILS